MLKQQAWPVSPQSSVLMPYTGVCPAGAACCAAGAYLCRLALAIDAAMRASSSHAQALGQQQQQAGAAQGDARQSGQGQGRHKKQAVHALHLVRARPFYGYHPADKLFIKIVL